MKIFISMNYVHNYSSLFSQLYGSSITMIGLAKVHFLWPHYFLWAPLIFVAPIIFCVPHHFLWPHYFLWPPLFFVAPIIFCGPHYFLWPLLFFMAPLFFVAPIIFCGPIIFCSKCSLDLESRPITQVVSVVLKGEFHIFLVRTRHIANEKYGKISNFCFFF